MSKSRMQVMPEALAAPRASATTRSLAVACQRWKKQMATVEPWMTSTSRLPMPARPILARITAAGLRGLDGSLKLSRRPSSCWMTNSVNGLRRRFRCALAVGSLRQRDVFGLEAGQDGFEELGFDEAGADLAFHLESEFELEMSGGDAGVGEEEGRGEGRRRAARSPSHPRLPLSSSHLLNSSTRYSISCSAMRPHDTPEGLRGRS